MPRHFNRSAHLEMRRELRRTMTPPEIRLWSMLRCRRMLGYRFRRQYGVDPFIVDFYCPQLKLAIELDGESHYVEGAQELDAEREQMIRSYGIWFLRFTNEQLLGDLNTVLQTIQRAIRAYEGNSDSRSESAMR